MKNWHYHIHYVFVLYYLSKTVIYHKEQSPYSPTVPKKCILSLSIKEFTSFESNTTPDWLD